MEKVAKGQEDKQKSAPTAHTQSSVPSTVEDAHSADPSEAGGSSSDAEDPAPVETPLRPSSAPV